MTIPVWCNHVRGGQASHSCSPRAFLQVQVSLEVVKALKHDAANKRTTMTDIVATLLNKVYGL